MSFTATLRQSGGSIILAIPKAIARSMDVEAGSVVDLSVRGRQLAVTPTRQGLAERLARSPKTPAAWQRDSAWLDDAPIGRELL